MTHPDQLGDPDGLYFVTLTTVGWIDVFTRPELKQIAIQSLRFCQRDKGLLIHARCLMTSHLHMIVSKSKDPLPDILRDFKKFTAKAIFKAADNVHEKPERVDAEIVF